MDTNGVPVLCSIPLERNDIATFDRQKLAGRILEFGESNGFLGRQLSNGIVMVTLRTLRDGGRIDPSYRINSCPTRDLPVTRLWPTQGIGAAYPPALE